MVNKLEQGDYVVCGGGVARLRGDSAIVADCVFRLQCRRGSFPFLPELGSRLWQLGRERRADRTACARQCCIEALSGTGVQVEAVSVQESAGALAVEVTLRVGQRMISAEVTV